MLRKQYKTRFVIKVGDHLKSIPVEDILFFYSLEKATYLCTADFRTYLVDYSLDHISEMIDEQRFFRINRKYILSNQSIADIVVYSNSRLKIKSYSRYIKYISSNIYSFSSNIHFFSGNIYFFSNNIYSFSGNIYSFSGNIYSFSSNIYSLSGNIHSFLSNIK